MTKPPIVFIDSGIGGLPYYRWVAERSNARKLVYVADNANFPYGEKQPERILDLAFGLVDTVLASFAPELIVLSCNTLSVVALADLRKRFPVPLVGVVPAVKPAAEESAKRSIGVIATKRTIEGVYLSRLIERFALGCIVHPYAANDLVDFVEKNALTAAAGEKLKACTQALRYFLKTGIDTLVLGCTHFIFMKDVFQTGLGPGVHVIDSVRGVGMQVLRLLREQPLSDEPGTREDESRGLDRKKGNAALYTTAPDPAGLYPGYASHFGLSYAGVMKAHGAA